MSLLSLPYVVLMKQAPGRRLSLRTIIYPVIGAIVGSAIAAPWLVENGYFGTLADALLLTILMGAFLGLCIAVACTTIRNMKYKAIKVVRSENARNADLLHSELQMALNRISEEGEELVSVTPVTNSGGTTIACFS